jgi:hypothetical protein
MDPISPSPTAPGFHQTHHLAKDLKNRVDWNGSSLADLIDVRKKVKIFYMKK